MVVGGYRWPPETHCTDSALRWISVHYSPLTDCPDFAENCPIFRKSRRGRQLMLDSPLSISVTGPQVTGTLLWFHPLCRKKNSSSSSYEWKKDTQLDGGFCYL